MGWHPLESYKNWNFTQRHSLSLFFFFFFLQILTPLHFCLPLFTFKYLLLIVFFTLPRVCGYYLLEALVWEELLNHIKSRIHHLFSHSPENGMTVINPLIWALLFFSHLLFPFPLHVAWTKAGRNGVDSIFVKKKKKKREREWHWVKFQFL